MQYIIKYKIESTWERRCEQIDNFHCHTRKNKNSRKRIEREEKNS